MLPDIEITLKGENAEAFAARMASEFATIFGEELVPCAPEAEATGTKGLETLAIIAVVLGVPRSILATMELADRIRTGDNWKRFVAWVKTERGDTKVEVTPRDGNAQAIEELHPAKILDPLADELRRTASAEAKRQAGD